MGIRTVRDPRPALVLALLISAAGCHPAVVTPDVRPRSHPVAPQRDTGPAALDVVPFVARHTPGTRLRVVPAPGERIRLSVDKGIVVPGGDRTDRSAIDSLPGPFDFLLRMRWPGERAPDGIPGASWIFTVVDKTEEPARIEVAHLTPDGTARLSIPLVLGNPNDFPIGIPPMEIRADSTGETVWPATPVPRDGGGTTIEPGTSRRVDYVATLRFVDGEERFSPNTRRLVLRLMPDLGDGPVPVGIPAP